MSDDARDDEAHRRRAAHGRERQAMLAAARQRKLAAIRGFTLPQRRALLGLITLFIACIAIGLWRNPTFVADPLPPNAPRYLELLDRLDPNDASAIDLAALPTLGERRARDIVAYRDRLREGDPQRIVFRRADDLMQVKGIGVAITQQIEPYLTFPTTQPATP